MNCRRLACASSSGGRGAAATSRCQPPRLPLRRQATSSTVPHSLSVQRACDTAPDAGLAHAGRPHQAQNLALQSDTRSVGNTRWKQASGTTRVGRGRRRALGPVPSPQSRAPRKPWAAHARMRRPARRAQMQGLRRQQTVGSSHARVDPPHRSHRCAPPSKHLGGAAQLAHGDEL